MQIGERQFFSADLIEIESITQLKQEGFGPDSASDPLRRIRCSSDRHRQ